MEVWSVEAVLTATVVEIERNQQRIVAPGPKVGLTPTSLMSPWHRTIQRPCRRRWRTTA